MNRLKAVVLREIFGGIWNRTMQIVGLACLVGGFGLVAVNPGSDALPYLLLQTMLYFGSLFGLLLGWSTAGVARTEGAFLFVQPVRRSELLAGKLLGSGFVAVVVLGLLMGPVGIGSGFTPELARFFGLVSVYVLVFLAIGLVIGFFWGNRTSGLLVLLLVWAGLVIGWDFMMMLLGAVDGVQSLSWLWVLLLFANPVHSLRLSMLFGLEMLAMNPGEQLDVMGFLFVYPGVTALVSFLVWLLVIYLLGWITLRQLEF